MIGIYKITNKINGKTYIGQSNNLLRRIAEHKRKRNISIDAYINILGVDNFDFEILEECKKEELDLKEQEYIKKYNSIENGYNIQTGGYNNSTGEGNGRAKITEEDVINIRIAYSEHKSPKKIYNTYFKDRISLSQFQAIWQGSSWSYIMPEVYTKENKQYYISDLCKSKILISPEEVYQYRKYYINHERKEVYQKYLEEHNQDKEILEFKSFVKILVGDVRPTSIYLTYPVYNKRNKK